MVQKKPVSATQKHKQADSLLFLRLHYQPKFYGYNLSRKFYSTPLRRGKGITFFDVSATFDRKNIFPYNSCFLSKKKLPLPHCITTRIDLTDCNLTYKRKRNAKPVIFSELPLLKKKIVFHK